MRRNNGRDSSDVTLDAMSSVYCWGFRSLSIFKSAVSSSATAAFCIDILSIVDGIAKVGPQLSFPARATDESR
jgi:hypothetical protein